MLWSKSWWGSNLKSNCHRTRSEEKFTSCLNTNSAFIRGVESGMASTVWPYEFYSVTNHWEHCNQLSDCMSSWVLQWVDCVSAGVSVPRSLYKLCTCVHVLVCWNLAVPTIYLVIKVVLQKAGRQLGCMWDPCLCAAFISDSRAANSSVLKSMINPLPCMGRGYSSYQTCCCLLPLHHLAYGINTV